MKVLQNARYLFLVSAMLACAAITGYAQSATGGIRGTITDQTGAVIAGAEVSIRNNATGAEANAVTNQEGIYRIPSLPPGQYTMTITAAGFKKAELKDLAVRLGVESTYDVQLQPGGSEEIVEVSAGEVYIEKAQAQISSSFDSAKITELPNNVAGGGIDAVALLTPGVVAPDAGASFGNTNGATISANGARARSNNFNIDGQDNNDISVTGPSVAVNNTDMVQEFQIITSNFSAEYGQASGAIVNIVTKGGSNELHGTAFLYHRNQKTLDTLTSQERRSGLKDPPPQINNIFGFTVGGPIKKDKVFFFGSFQGIEERSSFLQQSLASGLITPTPAGLAALNSVLPADIRNVLNTLAPFNQPLGNPTIQEGTTRIINVNVAGRTVPVQFAGIQRLIPTPSEEREYSVRIDWNVSDKMRVFGRYLIEQSLSENVFGNFNNGLVIDVGSRNQQLGFTAVYTFSPNAVNEFRFNYSRLRADFGGGTLPSATEANQAPAFFNLPTPFVDLGAAVNLPQGRLNQNYQFYNLFSYTAGRHSLKMGLDFKRRLTRSNFLPNQNGTFNFSTFDRFANDNPNSAVIAFGNNTVNFSEFNQYYFFQDDWRVRDNLTFNIGIRYENSGQPINVFNDITTKRESDPSTAFFNTNVPLEDRVVRRIDTDMNNFAPRIGFAYTPRFWKSIFGEDKTVFRGGYGIAYDVAFYNILLNVSTSTPVVLLATLPGTPGLVPGNPFGPAVRNTLQPLVPLRTLDPRLLTRTRVADDFHSPYTQHFSFGIQREITPRQVLEVRYVGSVTTGQFQSINANPLISAIARDFPSFLPPGVTPAANGRRLNQGLIRERINGASANYHGLQVRYDARYSDLFYGVSYTFSKQIDNASDIFFSNGSAFPQNPFDPGRGERALGDFDVRHNLAINFNYNIPVFKSQQGLVGKLLGGWQWSGTYLARPGSRYTPTQFFFGSPYADNPFNATFIGILDNLRPFLSNPNAPPTKVGIDATTAGVKSPTGFVDLGALNKGKVVPVTPNDVRFIVNTPVTAKLFGSPFGTAGRNSLQGDLVSLGNMGLFKNTKVGEKLNIQFRFEMFNVFNTQNFGVPDEFVDNAGTSFADFTQNAGSRRSLQFGIKLIF
ncbi:MAG: carboxypeptidase regulatory-like domain-containing protein [Acidobacteriota bacterium]|nr:carboxypeptidase regulatory-like domain-containing protein [Blastocatellia bacterium]MDW8412205.1 carboxypeptidase regulatory-like domain-containing protein [Acidobacteriota bacterium]